MQRAGLIGCGNISGAYLRNKDAFSHLRVVKCASRRDESARAAGFTKERAVCTDIGEGFVMDDFVYRRPL